MSFIGDLFGNTQQQGQPPQSPPIYSPSDSASTKVDPNDMSDKHNTKLSAPDEAAFQQWAKANPRLGNTYDYDARGFFKAGAGQAANGHGSDEFKKPNHPTFSDESKYSGVDGNDVGGTWGKDGDNVVTFTPSPANLKNMSVDELKKYFAKVEPDVKLVLPEDDK